MDEGPDAPVEAGEAAEAVDFVQELGDCGVGDCGGAWGGEVRGLAFGGEVRVVAEEVFAQERAPLGAGGEDGVVAVETAPFGEVVGDVEGGGGGGGVFVVDEVYG